MKHTYTSISSAGTSSFRLCLIFVNGDRITIIPFACENNGACVHVGVKIVLTIGRGALVVVITTEDEDDEEQEEEEEEDDERDEMLINDAHRLALCLLRCFLFLLHIFFIFNHNLGFPFLFRFQFLLRFF